MLCEKLPSAEKNFVVVLVLLIQNVKHKLGITRAGRRFFMLSVLTRNFHRRDFSPGGFGGRSFEERKAIIVNNFTSTD